ncbi:hypothetical protein, partial [Amedibacillus dolichus]
SPFAEIYLHISHTKEKEKTVKNYRKIDLFKWNSRQLRKIINGDFKHGESNNYHIRNLLVFS